MNDNILQSIIHEYLQTHPKPGEPPMIHLDVPTHDPDRDHAKFRVSDAGKCRLMRYWKRQGIVPSNLPSLDIRLVMESGNLIHAWIQHVLQAMHVLEVAEQELVDDHKIGHLDCLIMYKKNWVLYDLKTVSGKKMWYFHKHGERPDKAHIYQILTYHAMLADKIRPCPDDVRIAYISRDTCEIQECRIPLGHLNDVLDDWAALIAAWEVKMEPEPTAEAWECKYCAYKDRCHQEESV